MASSSRVGRRRGYEPVKGEEMSDVGSPPRKAPRLVTGPRKGALEKALVVKVARYMIFKSGPDEKGVRSFVRYESIMKEVIKPHNQAAKPPRREVLRRTRDLLRRVFGYECLEVSGSRFFLVPMRPKLARRPGEGEEELAKREELLYQQKLELLNRSIMSKMEYARVGLLHAILTMLVARWKPTSFEQFQIPDSSNYTKEDLKARMSSLGVEFGLESEMIKVEALNAYDNSLAKALQRREFGDQFQNFNDLLRQFVKDGYLMCVEDEKTVIIPGPKAVAEKLLEAIRARWVSMCRPQEVVSGQNRDKEAQGEEEFEEEGER